MFAGYIGSDNDTMVLQDFFRTLPRIIENRVVHTEWSLVIDLSNQIFKVVFYLFSIEAFFLYFYFLQNNKSYPLLK